MKVVPVPGNGWYPQISPSGRYVACGAGSVQVFDRLTNQITQIGQGYLGGWFDATTLYFLQGDSASARLCKAVAPGFVPAALGWTGPSNECRVRDGHWSIAVNSKRVTYDGKVLIDGPRWGCEVSG